MHRHPFRFLATPFNSVPLTSPEQLARSAVPPLDHRSRDRATAKRDLVEAARALAPRWSVPKADHQPFLALLACSLGVPAVMVRSGAEGRAPSEPTVVAAANCEDCARPPPFLARRERHQRTHGLEEFREFVLADVVTSLLVVVELVHERAMAFGVRSHNDVDLVLAPGERHVPDPPLLLLRSIRFAEHLGPNPCDADRRAEPIVQCGVFASVRNATGNIQIALRGRVQGRFVRPSKAPATHSGAVRAQHLRVGSLGGRNCQTITAISMLTVSRRNRAPHPCATRLCGGSTSPPPRTMSRSSSA